MFLKRRTAKTTARLHTGRKNQRMRGALAARLEVLEPRTMLAAAPVTLSTDWHADLLRGEFGADATVVLGPLELSLVIPPQELSAMIPGTVGAATDPGLFVGDGSDWSPPLTPPTVDDVDDGGQQTGGFVTITPRDQSGGDETWSSDITDQEARDVRAMVASLGYTPTDWKPSALDVQAEADDRIVKTLPKAASPIKSDVLERNDRDVQMTDPDALASKLAADTPSQEMRESGMVKLLRDSAGDHAAVDAVFAGAALAEQRVPVEVDNAYSKFQAFEVSSSEDAAPAGLPVENLGRAAERLEAEAAELQTSSTGQGLSANDATVSLLEADAVEATSEELYARPLVDPRRYSSLNVAAASLAALAAHVVRTTRPRSPEDDRPDLDRRAE